MARSGRARRRLLHHGVILLGVAVGAVLLSTAFGAMDLRTRVSMMTAYLGLGGIALSLGLGPLNLVRGRPNPVSSDLRRDVGIWAAVLSLTHVAVGLTVHLRGRMEQYFLPAPEAGSLMPVRLDPFGIANQLGLASGLGLLVLLVLSSDRALRRLGPARWKRWQRLNYWAAGAIALHGILYQVIERRRAGLVFLFSIVLAATLVVQALGIRERRSAL